jgi:hypothetical protein
LTVCGIRYSPSEVSVSNAHGEAASFPGLSRLSTEPVYISVGRN